MARVLLFAVYFKENCLHINISGDSVYLFTISVYLALSKFGVYRLFQPQILNFFILCIVNFILRLN